MNDLSFVKTIDGRWRGIPETGRGWGFGSHALRPREGTLSGRRPPVAPIPSWASSPWTFTCHRSRLAIEYQGQQHFDAVDLFGGEEGLAATKMHDSRKRALLATEGVRLFEWRYDLPVTAENVDKVLSGSSPVREARDGCQAEGKKD